MNYLFSVDQKIKPSLSQICSIFFDELLRFYKNNKLIIFISRLLNTLILSNVYIILPHYYPIISLCFFFVINKNYPFVWIKKYQILLAEKYLSTEDHCDCYYILIVFNSNNYEISCRNIIPPRIFVSYKNAFFLALRHIFVWEKRN